MREYSNNASIVQSIKEIVKFSRILFATCSFYMQGDDDTQVLWVSMGWETIPRKRPVLYGGNR